MVGHTFGRVIELIHTDCMEYMAGLPDKAFDLAIVDPPYGIGMEGGNNFWVKRKFDGQGRTWDHGIPDAAYWSELRRVSEHQIVWGGNYFTGFLPPRMGWIVWFKTVECVGRAFSEFEMAWTSFDRAARTVEEKPFQKGGSRIHPTQKPVALYRWLLKNYAKPGDRILDTHLGSGSIAIACDMEGFDLVGCEIDADYFAGASKRLKAHQSAPRLFDLPKPEPVQLSMDPAA